MAVAHRVRSYGGVSGRSPHVPAILGATPVRVGVDTVDGPG